MRNDRPTEQLTKVTLNLFSADVAAFRTHYSYGSYPKPIQHTIKPSQNSRGPSYSTGRAQGSFVLVMVRPLVPGEDVLQWLEERDREQTEGVRQMLLAEGRADLVANLDSRLKAIENGTDSAGRTWYALSEAQRKVVNLLVDGYTLVRRKRPPYWYGAFNPSKGIIYSKVCLLPTVRNLCARGLAHVAGDVFDPESKIVGTERAAFVAKFGPLQKRI